ncbi:hypothetical protein G1K52_12030 [Tenacibaculum finnmarkense]|uniref:TRADD-N-associated membrane domain-containing protein n=1 Tax=Tenacibaculum finnmarkense TaxID=2781243 RepID=UPI001E3ECE16|nr:hypothetical protein [Tenacibaculum finnmarkense]MCD8401464.1 hypothetical protein [Tenacibaculum finnmarkense genomovar ulcerans]MCG8786486.1 hypothetical protein [Tenacibaculum finnmarkense]
MTDILEDTDIPSMEESKTLEQHREDKYKLLKKKKEILKEKLDERNFSWKGWIISALIGGGLAYSYISIYAANEFSLERIIPYTFIGIFIAIFLYGYTITILRIGVSNQLRRLELELVQYGTDELQENISENFFTKLVQINFKYLDQYYLQTQEQADKSFKLAQFASVSGLVIISIGIIMMFFDKTQPAYVTTGAGVISELIASLFFYLYNRTILKMSQYHQKLVITQNISLALKISEDMHGEIKLKTQQLLIDRLTTDTNKYLSMQEK